MFSLEEMLSVINFYLTFCLYFLFSGKFFVWSFFIVELSQALQTERLGFESCWV